MTLTKSALVALSPLAFALASCGAEANVDTKGQPQSTPAPAADQVAIETQVLGTFNEPWAAAFEPGTGNFLITEKAGTIKLYRPSSGQVSSVTGGPRVDYGGQGGLGDIAFSPNYASDSRIYLSWIEAGDGDTRGAVVGRGQLACGDTGDCAIGGLEVIWRQSPKVTGRGHFSHRIAFSPDGQYLFVASGDRQKLTPAQDTSNTLGSIVRLNLDGIPADGNPLVSQGGVSKQIWSWGHRNILGMDFDSSGRLWELEHGPAGGDELNLVERGANYGWPVRSNGDNYDGSDIPDHASNDGFAQPALSWSPVIAPGNFFFYSGDLFAPWRGQAIIAGMKAEAIVRVAVDGEQAREVARIDMDNRIRQVVEGPDGAIWALEDGERGRLLRITPR